MSEPEIDLTGYGAPYGDQYLDYEYEYFIQQGGQD